MPQWGRPPGAHAGGDGGSWREQFDSRRRRFLDMDSESDDGYRRARLDPSAYKPGALPWMEQGVYASDELSFTGYDIGSGREARVNDMPYDRPLRSPDDGMYYEDYAAPRPSREDALVQSAKEKLRKARVKGRTNVSLSVEEMAALERSTLGTSEPTTPSKGKNRGSRSNSSTSLSTSRPRKTSNSFFGTSSPSHSRTRAPKNSRKSSNEQRAAAQPSGRSTPPAFMVRGPDGIPVYAPPSEYYTSPDSIRHPSSGSNRQVTPPYEAYSPAYASRYYSNPSDLRPPSSSSGYAPYEDPAAASRSRSTSGAGYPDLFGAPPSPAAQARRVSTGPSPDVAYAKLRRVPQGSPLSAMEAAADPRREWAEREGSSRRSSPSSSDDSGEGVRVEVEPQGSMGYSIKKVPVGSKSGVAVRRKGRK